MGKTATNELDRTLSVAPMLDWTDRHCRYFHRLLAPSALLYTEMVTTGAIIHGDSDRYLAYNPEEHPLALQLGGSDPADLAHCAKIAEQRGYDEVNLNVGCPSDRVQRGRFGACLMLEPELVADCVTAMREAVDIPVTVKTRLGVDEHYSYAFIAGFISRLAETGCRVFIMHARKAYLQGLSPKQNRDVPPLNYEWVYRLKREFPELNISLNGGVGDLQQVVNHLDHVDGVMIGRAAYQDPWLLALCEQHIGGHPDMPKREDIIERMGAYMERQAEMGVAVKHISRHMLGLFQGLPGAKVWRRYLSENAFRDDGDVHLLARALAAQQGIADGKSGV